VSADPVEGRAHDDGAGGRAVVGVGNPLVGDDGLGAAVVEAVADRGRRVRATHAGTTALLALEAMDGADRAAVVDAVALDRAPGTVVRRSLRSPGDERPGEAGPADRPDDDGGTDANAGDRPQVPFHDFTFAGAVASAGGAYDLPSRVTLVGVVPEAVGPGPGLSDAVARAVPRAADAALSAVGLDPADIERSPAPRHAGPIPARAPVDTGGDGP
jgi:hydrogenase maturation protease